MRSVIRMALLATVATFGATSARATTYAYGNLNLFDIVLSGLQSSNVSVSGANVSTSSSSSHEGYAPDGAAAGPASASAPLTRGSDVRESFSGPGFAPAQNTYTQALLNAAGSRGDSQMVGNLVTGAGSGLNSVAEGRLRTSGSASSTGGTAAAFNVSFVVNAPTTFELTFKATSNLATSTTLAQEFAQASVSFSFTIVDLASNTQVLSYAPGNLNTSISATAPGRNTSINNPSQAFDSGAVVLQGGTYQFTLLSDSETRQSSPALAVPEPASWVLMIVGFGAIGAARSRRKGLSGAFRLT